MDNDWSTVTCLPRHRLNNRHLIHSTNQHRKSLIAQLSSSSSDWEHQGTLPVTKGITWSRTSKAACSSDVTRESVN